jgi:hypothetical protein
VYIGQTYYGGIFEDELRIYILGVDGDDVNRYECFGETRLQPILNK